MNSEKNIISNATLLRTLTLKSILKFGKHADIPIWKLIEGGTGKAYLSWVYYNCSMINFNEEVLILLRIRSEKRINKPGINKEIFNERTKKIKKWQFATQGFKAIGKRKKAAKNYLRRNANLSKVTKGASAWSNQGHVN